MEILIYYFSFNNIIFLLWLKGWGYFLWYVSGVRDGWRIIEECIWWDSLVFFLENFSVFREVIINGIGLVFCILEFEYLLFKYILIYNE